MIRKMGDFEVNQRTKDGMFNATTLLKQWNQSNGTKKEIKDYFNNKSTVEFINQLKLDDEFLNRGNSPYLKTRGKKGGTWMHPYLFIDFAMWINPKFKIKVIKFVYDELIKNRHLAGDNYKLLSASGVKLKGYNFQEVAKAIQWIVFSKTGKELRQTANQEQLKEISSIEEKLSFAIDMGYIKTYEQLILQLRKMWKLKNQPF